MLNREPAANYANTDPHDGPLPIEWHRGVKPLRKCLPKKRTSGFVDAVKDRGINGFGNPVGYDCFINFGGCNSFVYSSQGGLLVIKDGLSEPNPLEPRGGILRHTGTPQVAESFDK